MISFKEVLKKLIQKFVILRKIKQLIYRIKKNIDLRKIMKTSSTYNIFALNELRKRRFEFTNNYFNSQIKYILKELPEIDLSIVTYNSSKWVNSFFRSLQEQEYSLKKINIYFIDNSSTDNTIELLNNHKNEFENSFKSISIISQKNLGFGAGHDRTFKEGKSDFCLVTNIDLEFEKKSIINIMKIVVEDKNEEYASWEFRQIPYEHPKYYDPITLETNWSSHACILIRKSAYEKVGGYEPKIFMYAEDVELSYRFRAYGYHLKYCPDAVVHHFTYEEANQIKPLQFQGSTLGNAYLRLRYGNKIDKLAIFPLYLSLLIRTERFKNSKKMIYKNIAMIFKNFYYFNKFSLSNKNFYASFREFEYEMIRDGAFHEIKLPEINPLISIIVRTYKERDTLLKQALISIGNQTYKNIEIIVVEDGGNTMEPLINSINHKLNIKYFGLEKIGRSATGNYGLSEASGEYCLFLDDDDLLFADHVEILLVALESNKQMAASYSLAFEIPTRFKDNKKDDYSEDEFRLLNVFYQEFDYDVLTHHNYFPIQTVMFKRSLFLERGGFDESLTYLEDWNLWLRYAHNNQFIYVPKTTSLYRVPADNTVAQERHELLEQAYIEAKEKAIKKIKEISNEN